MPPWATQGDLSQKTSKNVKDSYGLKRSSGDKEFQSRHCYERE
jgi:hypothetical protein